MLLGDRMGLRSKLGWEVHGNSRPAVIFDG